MAVPSKSSRTSPKKPLAVLDQAIERRIADGLGRLVEAGTQAAWHGAAHRGLSPTQGRILALLAKGPLRLRQVADALLVTPATASDAVRALVDKGLVKKAGDPCDARAIQLSLTARGRAESGRTAEWLAPFQTAVDHLSGSEKICLLRAVSKLMGSLQRTGSLSSARTCSNCAGFRENAQTNTERPHECTILGQALADADLQTACPVFEERQ